MPLGRGAFRRLSVGPDEFFWWLVVLVVRSQKWDLEMGPGTWDLAVSEKK